jgi:endonuclease/exonuclease/phosphatase (EEP) superfamily protein YafD
LDHRGNVEEDRIASIAKIRELLTGANTDWQIVAGDFNARPDSQTYRDMAAQFKDAWTIAGRGEGFTIPVRKPTARIDYVWFAGDPTLKPARAEVLRSEASDHLPLLVEFEIAR